MGLVSPMNGPDGKQANPYAPPASDVNSAVAPPPAEGELALRGTRFVAQMLDGLLYGVVLIPAFVIGVRAGAFSAGDRLALYRTFTAGSIGMISGLCWLALLAFQAYLISTTGQSLGKRWLRIKIVKRDGAPVNFISGVLLRHWLFFGLQQVPGMNLVAGLIDPLFIFREDRRCIHDMIAGTKVVQLKDAAQIRVA
jgi:uncharacterized RDD family membrane protein YckC